MTLTPLRLHSASSVRIPNSINNFRTLIPALRLRPLNLLSASSVNLHGLANTSIFHNNLRVMLSPLKSPVLRKYSNPFKRPGMYPSISKCNAKRCNCCMHLCTNSTLTSSVNGRKFSVVNNSDLDWKSIDLIYVLTWKTKNCNMQYVGQTCRALQKRFGEHYRRMKKPKPIDTFLYQHFKLTGHSPNDALVQPVEKLTYEKNSSSRFKIIKRHESKSLNRLPIRNLQNCSMFPLAFDAGWLQGHWWGFISRNYVVWPTFLLMNVFIALKGSHFWFLFDITAAGVVPCGGRKTSPRTSTIVQFIFYFGPLRSAIVYWEIRNKWLV